MDAYYTSRKRLLLLGFDLAARLARGVMVSRYGTDHARMSLAAARREFAGLLPQIPYIGGRRNQYTGILVSSAMFLALYRVLAGQGKSAEEVGTLIYAAMEAAFDRVPRFLLRLYGKAGMSASSLRKARQQALASQARRYPGDWLYTVVAEPGYDHGLDFSECALVKFFREQGAPEMVPYLCRLDIIQSERLGWGMVRTSTLAGGGEKCDFRYRLAWQAPQTRPPA